MNELRFFAYDVTELTKLTTDIYKIVGHPREEKLPYQAGQYTEVLYPDQSLQPFSIANAPTTKGEIEIHVRQLAEDRPTHDLLVHLEKTQHLILKGPYGQNTYQRALEDSILLLAGGVGIVPMLALLEEACRHEDARRWHLFWTVKAKKDLYVLKKLQGLLAQLDGHMTYRVAAQEHSRIFHDMTQANADLARSCLYASGPYDMIVSAVNYLEGLGLARTRVFSDVLDYF